MDHSRHFPSGRLATAGYASLALLASIVRRYVRTLPFSPALVVFLFVALLPSSLSGQRFAWATSGGGIWIDQTSALRVGTNGNVLVSGTYSGTASFGTIVLNGQGDLVPFLAEYDGNGNVLSARSGDAFNNGTVVEAAGNVFKGGYFYGTATFGTNIVVSKGGWDIYLAKYSSAGELLWVRRYGGTKYEGAFALAIDGAGSLYLVGDFWGSLELGTNLLASHGFSDAFVMKCDAAGNILWARSGGGADYDGARTVACDNGGNVFLAGTIYADATFGTNTLLNEGAPFVAKYGPTGNVLWADCGTSQLDAEATCVAIDAHTNIFLGGRFSEVAVLGGIMLSSVGSPLQGNAGRASRFDSVTVGPACLRSCEKIRNPKNLLSQIVDLQSEHLALLCVTSIFSHLLSGSVMRE